MDRNIGGNCRGDSILCLKETLKKVDDIKIVKYVKIKQTMREMQDGERYGLLIMYKEKEIYDLQDDNEKHRNTACRRRYRKRTN